LLLAPAATGFVVPQPEAKTVVPLKSLLTREKGKHAGETWEKTMLINT
jgi:hypothetical protein